MLCHALLVNFFYPVVDFLPKLVGRVDGVISLVPLKTAAEHK